MIYIGDLGMMEDELRKYERDIAQGVGGGTPSIEGVRSMVQTMLDTINKSKSFFSEQIEVIRKISPPAAEQLDNILIEYEDLQEIIEAEFKKESKMMGKHYIQPELIENLDKYVHDLGRYYDEMRKSMTLAYNCIVGTVSFMVPDDLKKTGKVASRGRGGRRRVL